MILDDVIVDEVNGKMRDFHPSIDNDSSVSVWQAGGSNQTEDENYEKYEEFVGPMDNFSIKLTFIVLYVAVFTLCFLGTSAIFDHFHHIRGCKNGSTIIAAFAIGNGRTLL